MASCSLSLLANCILLSYLSSVADGDGLTSMNATIQCSKQEREALLQFKQGVEDNCYMLSSWGDPDQPDCCTWHGIHCSHHTGHVIVLDLHGKDEDDLCLKGKVSPSLLELKHLTYLDLSYSNFQNQSIPSFIGSLSNLQHLNLSLAGFTGEIPPQLGNLSKLTSLDLSYNYAMNDTDLSYNYLNVKGLEWLNHLTLLRVIDLSGINLTEVTDSWLQVINNLPFLTSLRMDECGLISPTIPPSLSYANSTTTLGFLSLYDNGLNGASIFQWLFNLSGTSSHLVHLELSFNSISGPVPSEFGNMQSLSYLDLSQNKLRGPIPSGVWNMPSLVYLDLSNNLNLSSTSTLPKSHGGAGLCSLQRLDLNHSNFTGDVSNIIQPLSTCANSSLEYLDLSSNRLQGTLSNKHLSNLVRLKTLKLSDNVAIVINVSANWIAAFQLDDIELRSCKLGPSFPRWLLTQTNFSVLDISSTGISDSIPTSFWTSLPSRLETLDLSNNLISGGLPDCWKKFYQLIYLALGNNNFTGQLPASVGSLERLVRLDLRYNNFNGQLPMSLKNITSLFYLDLSHNSFIGHIPSSIWNSPTMLFLDLSHNSFIGHIPSWKWSAMLNLLNLGNNKFEGKIPLSLCQLSGLQVLDLSSNHFSGTIPECIYNLTTMKTIGVVGYYYFKETMVMWKRKERSFGRSIGLLRSFDISDNELEGQIPGAISSLTGLGSLDLSRNKLSGSIPSNIGQLTALQFLDLSSNRLSGGIPTSLSNVASLEMLDLSNNILSGIIPQGTQLQSFSPSNYNGNPHLCGAPLPSCPGDQAPVKKITQEEENDSDAIFPGLYISMVLGFITGFWAVCGSLVLKRSWRRAYFRFFDDTGDRLHVMFALCIARLWRRKREVSG